MTTYSVHGLAVRSDLALPELAPGDFDEADADLTIRLGAVPLVVDVGDGPDVREAPDGERIFTSDCGRFLIRGGREIIVDPYPEAIEEQLRARILGPSMAMLLHQRGMLVLHASAVGVGGEAAAVLGTSGEGKSTLSATLHRRGHDIITDDILGLDPRRRPLMVSPGFPQIRLWPDSIVSLGESPEQSPPAAPGVEKRACKVYRGFAEGPMVLKRIYVLAEGDRVEIAPLAPTEACMALVEHSYSAATLGAGDGAVANLRRCAAAAKRVDVCRLSRPLGLSTLPAVAAAVEEDMARPSA